MGSMDHIFVELRRKPVSFSPYHFWIDFKVQCSSWHFSEKFTEVKSVCHSPLWSHNHEITGDHVLVSIHKKSLIQSSVKNFTWLFPSLRRAVSLHSSWYFHCFGCVIQKSAIRHMLFVFICCYYLVHKETFQTVIQFLFRLCYVPIAYILKYHYILKEIIILKLLTSC